MDMFRMNLLLVKAPVACHTLDEHLEWLNIAKLPWLAILRVVIPARSTLRYARFTPLRLENIREWLPLSCEGLVDDGDNVQISLLWYVWVHYYVRDPAIYLRFNC